MGVLRVDADALTVQHELHATLLDRAVLGIRIQQILAAGGAAASAIIDNDELLKLARRSRFPCEPGDVVSWATPATC
jgi:hypothetical protein